MRYRQCVYVLSAAERDDADGWCALGWSRYEEVLADVASEQWRGCTASVSCLAPAVGGRPQLSLPLTDAEQARARGDTSVRIRGRHEASATPVPLSCLLIELECPVQLDAEARGQIGVLQLARDLGWALRPLADAPAVRRFWQALNRRLDAELGGSFVDGFMWSALLALDGAAADAARGAGEMLLDRARLQRLEAVSSGEIGSGRVLGLMECLGELYEHSHELLAAYPAAMTVSICTEHHTAYQMSLQMLTALCCVFRFPLPRCHRRPPTHQACGSFCCGVSPGWLPPSRSRRRPSACATSPPSPQRCRSSSGEAEGWISPGSPSPSCRHHGRPCLPSVPLPSLSLPRRRRRECRRITRLARWRPRCYQKSTLAIWKTGRTAGKRSG